MLTWIALGLLLLSGLNRGFVGIFKVDLVESLAGKASPAGRVINTLIGIAGIYTLWMLFTNR